MRKISHAFVLFALFAAAVSCGKQTMALEPDETTGQQSLLLNRYTFDIAEDLSEDISRATLDNQGVFWEPGDMVGIYLADVGNEEAEINTETSPKTVTLRSANSIPDGTAAYAYYPFSETVTNPAAVTFHIPDQQSGGLVSGMPMAGIPFTVSAGTTSNNGQIYFMNLGAIIDFKVYSSSYSGETVRSVTFQSYGTTIAGDAVVNLSAVDPDDEETLAISSWGSRQYDHITVLQNAPVAVAKADATSIYMVLAPGTYASGTITIVTDAATYSFPFSDKALARNELKHYTMNLNNATRQVLTEKSTFPYTEAFTSGQGDFIVEGGTVKAAGSWNEITYSSNYGAKISGRYADGGSTQNHTVSTALVSPWINLSGLQGTTLTFDHIINNYLDLTNGSAGVYVMAEGDESWAKLEVDFPSTFKSSGYSDWLSVTKDLSAYDGRRIRIKFAYKSTTSSCGVWEIKDFKVDAHVPVPTYSLYSGEITEGDYVIYYGGKAMKNTVASNRLEYSEVTPSNDQIVDPDASIVWHIAPSGDYWTIYNAALSKYAASTGTKNQAQLLQSGSDNKSLWTVSGSSTYEFVNRNNSSAGVNANLRNNGTYGFACYSTQTGGALTLYKLGFESSTGGESGGGGEVPSSDLPGHLGCFEIPAVVNASYSGEGNEVVPTTNPTKWYRYNTGSSNQKIVTHTFRNTHVSPNRIMRSYTLLQDYNKKCALWVACSMNNDVYPNAVDRKEKWCYDPALPTTWQPNLENSYPDKDGASYDRGHQLAASYRETTTDQVKMTCYFTNMTPQLSKLNSGRWQSTVEANVRNLGANTTGRDTLYVVSGPLFIGSYGTVEDKDGMSCARPTHYFQCFMKVSFNASGVPTSAKGAAYLVEHVATPAVQYKTIDEIETLSGFDFFANVPSAIQEAAEATATSINNF